MAINSWHILKFTAANDPRGDLVAIDFENQLPFKPHRFFITFNVPSVAIRGEHAHIQCEQILVALSGSIKVTLDSGKEKQEFLLSEPETGLYIPKMTWGTQESLSESSILGVFASHKYDETDYIRKYGDFTNLVNLKI